MRHHIGHRIVTLVSYSRNYGQREIGYVECQIVGVKAAEFTHCAAAPYYYHNVKVIPALCNGVQGLYHAALHIIALHQGREQLYIELKSVNIVCQLVAEIAPTGGSGR